jgi:DNA-binding GntR family transcriptional regulator
MDELKTKERLAYDKLKDLIIHVSLPRNEFLSQRMLSAKIDSTLINVRSALRQLESDGLIENVPQWGVRIPVEDEETLRDRYYVREVLELAAVRRIVVLRPIRSAQDLMAIAKRCDEISSQPDSDISDFTRHHYELHCGIVKASASPRLFAAYGKIQLQSLMLWNAQRSWLRGMDRGNDHHQQLLSAILQAPEVQALEATREHIQHGLRNELDCIAQEKECQAIGYPASSGRAKPVAERLPS